MLDKKRILVAGAGGLLGSHIVKALVNSGAEVIAVDIDLTATTEKLKQINVNMPLSSIRVCQLDLTDETKTKDFFRTVESISGAVNSSYPRNSAYGRHFFDVTLEDFNENVALNLGSAFLFSQQCAAYFNRLGSPFSLVNISSVYGVVAPRFSIYENTSMTMPVEYAAIKSAIIMLNQYIANYVSNSDFRINSVSPGGIFDNQPANFLEKYKEHSFGKGLLHVDDVVGTVEFLLSDASKYINGQNIIVDDGFVL